MRHALTVIASVVTFEVSHFDVSRLNEFASQNVYANVVTFEVSHFDVSPLNWSASQNCAGGTRR